MANKSRKRRPSVDGVARKTSRTAKSVGKAATDVAKTAIAVKEALPIIKAAGKVLISAFNDESWYGGESNQIVGPQGLFVPGIDFDSEDPQIFQTYVFTPFEPGAIIDMNNIAGTQLKSLISAFEASLGYSTSLTVTHLQTYLKTVLNFASVVKSAQTFFSSKNVPIFGSLKLSDIYASMFDVVAVTPTSHVNPLVDAISNAEWLQDYVGFLLSQVALPHHMELIEYIFDGAFVTNPIKGSNGYLISVPEIFKDHDSFKDMLTASKASLTTASNANPYIIPFLTYLGFQPISTMGLDFNRDIAGISILQKVDPMFDLAYENATLGRNSILAKYTLTTDGDIGVEFDMKNINQSMTIGMYGELRKLNYMSQQANRPYITCVGKYGSNVKILNGTDMKAVAISAKSGFPTGTSVTAAALTDLSQRGRISVWNLVGLNDFSHLQTRYSYNTVSATPTAVGEYSVTSEVYPGTTDMFWIDDYTLYDNIVKTNFALGLDFYSRGLGTIGTLAAQRMVR